MEIKEIRKATEEKITKLQESVFIMKQEIRNAKKNDNDWKHEQSMWIITAYPQRIKEKKKEIVRLEQDIKKLWIKVTQKAKYCSLTDGFLGYEFSWDFVNTKGKDIVPEDDQCGDYIYYLENKGE